MNAADNLCINVAGNVCMNAADKYECMTGLYSRSPSREPHCFRNSRVECFPERQWSIANGSLEDFTLHRIISMIIGAAQDSSGSRAVLGCSLVLRSATAENKTEGCPLRSSPSSASPHRSEWAPLQLWQLALQSRGRARRGSQCGLLQWANRVLQSIPGELHRLQLGAPPSCPRT